MANDLEKAIKRIAFLEEQLEKILANEDRILNILGQLMNPLHTPSRTWWVVFGPDRNTGAIPFEKGPFLSREQALGWASKEMASQPKNWWSVEGRDVH